MSSRDPTSFAVERVPGPVAVVAITDEGLGNTTWAMALDDAVVVVDPERDPAPYLAAVEAAGWRDGSDLLVADTHLHADFISGAAELAALGATAIIPASADARWTHRPVANGESFDFGRWRLEVRPTPGHTPEHVAYLLRESGRPTAAFTGGSLLVGAVARTDLIDPGDTEGLTRALWHSINRELLSLPDDVLLLPTHGAGSFCSAAGGSRRWTTVGDERNANPLLAVDENTFVRTVLDSLGTFPPYFLRLRERNRLGPHVFGSFPLLDDLPADRTADLRERGAIVVDVRPVADYAAAHVPGALANALRPQFASWLGWLVDQPDTPLVFVTDAHTDRRELVRQCLNIGYENLAGAVTIETWRATGGELRHTPLVETDGTVGRHVVDVRQDDEYAAGHLPDSAHVELGRLPGASRLLPEGALAVMCGHGERAATAASLLETLGHDDVAIVIGGPPDWAARTGQTLRT